MATIGAGVLSFPLAAKSSGILLNSFWTILFAFSAAYSSKVLAQVSQTYFQKLQVFTIEELALVVLGRRWYNITVCVTLFVQIGALTGYTIVIADVTQPVLSHWLGWSTLAIRAMVISFFTVFLLLPLSFTKNLHNLSISSIIGIASVLAVVVVVFVKGSEKLSNHSSSDIEWLINPGIQIFLSPPICVFAFMCQLQVIAVYAEMKDNKKDKMGSVIAVTISLSAILYILVGTLGYLAYGHDTKGDILLNLPVGDALSEVARILMALHVTLAIPVFLLPTKRTIAYLLFNWFRIHQIARHEEDGLEHQVPSQSSTISGLVVLGATSLIAVLYPQIAIIFALVGATGSTYVMFFVPAMLLLKDTSQASTRRSASKAKAGILISLAVVLSVVGTATVIQQNF